MNADHTKYFEHHDLHHNGQQIKLRSFSTSGDHEHDFRWVSSWSILTPRQVAGSERHIGTFERDELELAKNIAADYFSFGPAE